METIVYRIPSNYLSTHKRLSKALSNKQMAVLEHLPKTFRQKLTPHITLGHLKLERLEDLGLTLVSDKNHNALLAAVRLEPRYPRLAEIIDSVDPQTSIEIQDS